MCIPKSTISAYENVKVDIKSSVIVEIAKVLETDEKVSQLLLVQIGALSDI